MAFAKLVCGDCGAALSQTDTFCPQCGVRVEDVHGASGEADSRVWEQTRHCRVCGNTVVADANFCESCGAALAAARSTGQKKQAPLRRSAKADRTPKKAFSFQPWQLITGVVVLSLVVFFAYTELTRERARPKASVQENFLAPSAVMLQEIEQLQRTVDSNPTDGASLLRLANALHDAAMRDSRLLMRAITTYAKYLQLKPGDPNARVDMAICYFEMARVDSNNAGSLFSRSIQEMQTVFAANPKHQPATFNLGIVNLNAGNLEESNRWFKKTVEINPNSDLGKRAQQLLEQHSFQGSPN